MAYVDKEFRAARSYATIIRSRADWKKGSGDYSILRWTGLPSGSRPRQDLKIQSALRRAVRVVRFVRFLNGCWCA